MLLSKKSGTSPTGLYVLASPDKLACKNVYLCYLDKCDCSWFGSILEEGGDSNFVCAAQYFVSLTSARK